MMVRRLIDLTFAVFWLIVTAPVILAIAVLIRLDSSGPALYTPTMIGRNGRLFRLFRFRTMHVDAPAHLSPDEKLTRVGRFIRNYSLDHLPQLFNVLSRDLSVIGPRPMEPEFVDVQGPTWQKYFQVKPGLFHYAVLMLGRTFGPSSGGNLGLKQELELEYIQKRSLLFDLQLFWRTVVAHIASKGNVKVRGVPAIKVKDERE
jgi:lipopolysaccharide/colanic/teichoic acid biosynthesis glycosyltransferase